MERVVEKVSRIELFRAFGNPAELVKERDRVQLGRVIGRAESILTRSTPVGGKYEGFAGAFELMPADETKPASKADQCFFPSAMHAHIAQPLRDAKQTNKGACLEFVFDVAVTKAATVDGYTWEYTPIVSRVASDPLAHLRGDKSVQEMPAPKEHGAAAKRK